MVTLNFANGNSQTYSSYNQMMAAVQAMGGEAVSVGNNTYVFKPKN